jgi:cytidylate kinase
MSVSVDILKRLELLEAKALKLALAHKDLTIAHKELQMENQKLRNQMILKEEEVRNFHNQEKISKIVTSITDDTYKRTELKLKINEYIKEIDKCIAFIKE